jgi:choice-of-anchor A domain-containing protein
LFAANAGASGVCSGSAPDYLLFSAGSINYSSAHVQGRIAALDQINLETFHLTGAGNTSAAVVSAGTLDLHDSNVEKGGAECAGPVRLLHSTVEGQVADQKSSTRIDDLERIRKWIEDKSARMFQLSHLLLPAKLSEGVLGFQESDGKTAVYNVAGDELSSATQLQFQGKSSSLFIVNVTGGNVVMRDVDFKLSDEMKAGQIVFNFVTATTLQITISGAHAAALPATIIAPQSALHLSSGKIAGAVFAADIMGNADIEPAPVSWQKLCSVL